MLVTGIFLYINKVVRATCVAKRLKEKLIVWSESITMLLINGLHFTEIFEKYVFLIFENSLIYFGLGEKRKTFKIVQKDHITRQTAPVDRQVEF